MPLINRFKRAVQAGRSATTPRPDSASSTVAALVIGPGLGELAAASAWLRSTPKGRGILITDEVGVEHYQLPGLVTEFLPTGHRIGHRIATDPARKLYVQRRLAVIFTKWAVSRCVAIGPEAETLLAAVTSRGWQPSDFPTMAKAAVG
jgi:hypothetical protein